MASSENIAHVRTQKLVDDLFTYDDLPLADTQAQGKHIKKLTIKTSPYRQFTISRAPRYVQCDVNGDKKLGWIEFLRQYYR